MDPRLNVMQLDNKCCVEKLGSARLTMYRIIYRELAEEMRVRLASEAHPSRAFPLKYLRENTWANGGVKWTWKMPEEKSTRLMVLLAKCIREGS
jgi:hypothetical protein